VNLARSVASGSHLDLVPQDFRPTFLHMTQTAALRTAAIFGFLAVALGAFGAHALKEILASHATTAIWEKAVFYHFVHAVMLYLLAARQQAPQGPWLCFLIGVTVFSGSLYLLAGTNIRWLGAVTPLGGLSLLGGWLWLVIKPGALTGVTKNA
jgi:uncharacterized membrane protein YgdD (TMEM256/DUF423 family)